MEVSSKLYAKLPKLAREALRRMTCEDPSQPGSETDLLAAELLHDCNVVIGLTSLISDLKEKHEQVTQALDELLELQSYMENSVWEGVDKPVVLLKGVYGSQESTVIALMGEQIPIAEAIWRELEACKVFLDVRDAENIPSVVIKDERFMAKYTKANFIVMDVMRLTWRTSQKAVLFENMPMSMS